MQDSSGETALRNRIKELEHELADARARSAPTTAINVANGEDDPPPAQGDPTTPAFNSALLPSHPLLLLTDTALPLGSFAFSSGLESYLAHHAPANNARSDTLHKFMHMSIVSLASTTLPYLLTTFKAPERIRELDDELDACLLCPVTKRASISQGRALITIWERSLRGEASQSAAKETLQAFCAALKAPKRVHVQDEVDLNAHFPLVYAVVCAAQGLTLHETAFTYLFNHAKAIASAAVRASVLGPYASQALLGSRWLAAEIERAMETEWVRDVHEAGQAVPALDVWIGRHELLYSRIFNS